MIMQSIKNEVSPQVSISLQDLLDENAVGYLTKYLSVSIRHLDDVTKVTLTTTGKSPLSYSAVFPTLAALDLERLVFVVELEGRV